LGVRIFNRRGDTSDFVCGKVIHDNHVMGMQRLHQVLLHVSQENVAVHRAIDHQRRDETVEAQADNELVRLPVAVRHLGDQTVAAKCSTV